MLNNLNQMEQHDYSQNIFIGKVVANNDPLRLRRVKCSIPNMYEEQDPATLPWIAPMFFGVVANGAGGGSAHLQPAIGTELVIEFQMGSPLHGLYIASPMRPDQLPAGLVDADWQWTYGWKDPTGNIFLVNSKAGSNNIRLFHASGTEFNINNAGRINIHGVENLDIQIDGNTKLTTNGNVDVITQGNVTTTTQGNVSHTVQGSYTLKVSQFVLIETPTALIKTSTLTQVQSPIMQVTGLLQAQNFTMGGLSGPGTMNVSGGTINYSNVAITYTAGTMTYNGKDITNNHFHINSGGAGNGGVVA
jgi:hypothetical protein